MKGAETVEEKLFDLMTKMYNEMQGMKTQHTEQIKELEQKIDKLLENQEKYDIEVNVVHTRAH